MIENLFYKKVPRKTAEDFSGGDTRTRTVDLLRVKQAL